METQNIVYSIIFALAIGLLSAYIAHRNGRNPYIWFAIGFFTGLWGLLILLFMGSPKKGRPPKESFVEPTLTAGEEPDTLEIFPLVAEGPVYWYYLDDKREQQGPLPIEELKELADKGGINADTYVWNENLPEWILWKETSQDQKPISEV